MGPGLRQLALMFERVRKHPDLGDEQPQGDDEDALPQAELKLRTNCQDHRSGILGGKQRLGQPESQFRFRRHGV